VYADISPAEGARLPVIPKHLQSIEGIKAAGKRHAGRQAHRAAYHGIRTPKYLVTALWWAVIGVFRIIGRQIHWWWHMEAHSLQSQAAAAGDSREYMKLHKESKEVRKVRGGILAGEVLAVVLACVLLVRYAPWWAWLPVGALALPALARAGRPADKPIVTPAVVTPRFRVLNADAVLRAYYAAGLGNPDRPGQQIAFPARMARDGDGTRCLIDLPYGKGLKEAIDAKDKIASGLDVTESQVFIRRDRPPTGGTRCGLPTVTRWPCRSAARRCWLAGLPTSGGRRRWASTSAASSSPCR
jgi:DNA segregation ATPase FtsK/SpoIIIE, S-DNA-T family